MTPRTALLIAALAGGCAASIQPDKPDASTIDAAPSDSLVPTGPVTTGDNGDGTFTTIVDATAVSAWTYLDFETKAQATETGPWDLRWQRFHISTNGGVSGTGGVEIAALAGTAFADVTTAPSTGWFADAPDGEDSNLDPDYAFEQGEGWYDYNPTTHVLTPKPIVWIVRTDGGGTIKLELQRYYDTAGTPGWMTFRWAPL